MNDTPITIFIPSELATLPHLSLAERVLLVHISAHPNCSNADLGALLGLSLRGVEAMLRRLRQRGLIQQVGKGRARLHRLMFEAGTRTKRDEAEANESRKKSGKGVLDERHIPCGPDAASNVGQSHPATTQTSSCVSELSRGRHIMREMELASDSFKRGELDEALRRYQGLKEYFAALSDVKPEVIATGLAGVMEVETRVLAIKLVVTHAEATQMPRPKLRTLLAAISALDEKRLTQIRPALDAQTLFGRPVDISALLFD